MTVDEVERNENGNGTCGESCLECPLCMEPLDLDDISFYPCTCGYQVCKFCWHRMKTDENGLCPACRQKYPDDPVEFKPVGTEEMQKFKVNKKQRIGQKKKDGKDKGDRIIDSRKHLATIRVVQKNLVFVIGLPPKLTDPETLKRPEYFGKFGKIVKVMVNTLNANGTPASSASAYITYLRSDDSLRAIKTLNNFYIEGRVLKASLGTTKYCVNFLKNQPCAKGECMYLHDHGDNAASFTKEEMQQGKHQEYEKQLLDSLNPLPAGTPTTPSMDIARSLTKISSIEEINCGRSPPERNIGAMQRDPSPCSSSSLSSSSGSSKSDSNSERASPSVAFDLFIDTFDEFGFDPWNESSKGLADLMEMESRTRAPPSNHFGFHAFGHQPNPFPHASFGYGQQSHPFERQVAPPSYQHINHEAGMVQHGNGIQGGMYVQRRPRNDYEQCGDELAYSGQKWSETARHHMADPSIRLENVSTMGHGYPGSSGEYNSSHAAIAFQNSRLSVQ